MKAQRKGNDDHEYDPLINHKVKTSIGSNSHEEKSSRLEWAEASWTRFMSVILFWWIKPLLSKGYKRLLTEEDIDDLPQTDKSATLYEKVKDYDWTHTSTFKILAKVFWKRFVFVGCLLVLNLAGRTAQPLLVNEIVTYSEKYRFSQDASIAPNYIYVVLLFICGLIQAPLHQQYYFCAARLNLMMQNTLTSMIYNRLLSVKTVSLQQTTTACMINLVVDDATKFENLIDYIHFLWGGPLEAIIVFFLLWWIIGIGATVSGYIVFVLMIPVFVLIGRLFSKFRQTTVNYTDHRIHTLEEIIAGCQVIKTYHWEKAMEERVREIRKKELASIRRTSFLRAFNIGIFFLIIPLLGFATYTGAWLFGTFLPPSKLFVALIFYGQMRLSVIYSLPTAIEKVGNIRVAFKRIDDFVKLTTEQQSGEQQQQQQQLSSTFIKSEQYENGAITMRNASFSWYGHDNCLSSLNIDIERGTFVGIAGPVGSGKSSLFAAILGEMTQTNGELDLHGSSLSYAPQSSWIFADTLRANILLGKPFNENRYVKVLHACCLDIDLSIFGARGDLIVIGEKGVNLSGGQKARVSLARALYTDADIYLLDDPLAAVDSKVAKHIYDQCIGPHGLLSEKTRVLITHQTQYLRQSNQTILFDNGHIVAQGLFNELPIEQNSVNQTDDADQHKEPVSSSMLDVGQSVADDQSIIVGETLKSNTVDWSVWYSLFTAPPLGIFGLLVLVILIVAGVVYYNVVNFWLNSDLKKAEKTGKISTNSFYIFLILMIFMIIISLGRPFYYFYHILNGTNYLHNKMVSGLLYTLISFFESNPSGRILNRISRDQQIIDEVLPWTLFDAVQLVTLTIGIIVAIIIIIPWSAIPFAILTPIFFILRHFYFRSSRQLKWLESATRSPVYALFTSSLNGLDTIRAFKVKDDFMKTFMNRINVHTSAYLNTLGASRWFGLQVDFMTVILSFVLALFTVIFRDTISISLMVLCLMYSIQMTQWLQWGIRQLSEAQNLMTSVERINEYGQLQPEEDEGGSKRLIKTPADWPDCGKIEFRNYSLCYRPNLEPALKNISLTIKPNEKVGIIGRTGAGKSSIFQSLLRLTERSTVGGEILIDDIDISRITLSHLRAHLSVVLQNPMLFTGTLRYNLDPFNDYSDEECWMALEAVQLKKMVSDYSEGLLMPITKSSGNLSVGQRQLICVARAILKKSKILLIDEATANVDKETDRLLHSVISENFQDRTVLTIAHRLNTVATNDRLLMLDRGTVVDFDIPNKILPQFE